MYSFIFIHKVKVYAKKILTFLHTFKKPQKYGFSNGKKCKVEILTFFKINISRLSYTQIIGTGHVLNDLYGAKHDSLIDPAENMHRRPRHDS